MKQLQSSQDRQITKRTHARRHARTHEQSLNPPLKPKVSLWSVERTGLGNLLPGDCVEGLPVEAARYTEAQGLKRNSVIKIGSTSYRTMEDAQKPQSECALTTTKRLQARPLLAARYFPWALDIGNERMRFYKKTRLNKEIFHWSQPCAG